VRGEAIADPTIRQTTGGGLPYRIEYSPNCEHHLRVLPARDRIIVLDAVEEQLAHQPDVRTQNRKRMRPNPLAPWELSIGNLRVYI
jgi:mRNA-degrading endonuclease RelE of RelBE toxin-antitoxin system